MKKPLEVVAQFPCGQENEDAVIATLYSNGEMIVRGKGEIKNYPFKLPPWHSLRKKIKSIIVMNGVTRIGSSSFIQLPKLAKVYFHDSVKEIGKYAFVGCPKLTKVVLPMHAEHENAFDDHVTVENAKPLKYFNHLEAKPQYRVWGTLYSNGHLLIEGNGPMANYKARTNQPWYWDAGNILFITIRNGVTTTGAYAFKGLYMLRSVEMEKVITVGRHSFEACKALVDLKMNLTAKRIGSNAFSNCPFLLEVSIPTSTQKCICQYSEKRGFSIGTG